MFIDNGTGDEGQLKIDIDGHEYVEQENYSYEQNGVMDSVAVDTADGNHIVYTDLDHNGTADAVTEYDAHGNVVAQAGYDAQSGRWVEGEMPGSQPSDPTSTDAGTNTGTGTGTEAGNGGGGGGTIMVDGPDGEHSVGPATADANNDGTPDTAVVHDAQGDIILYTDTNNDGHADYAAQISPDGHVVVAEHTGDHQWTEIKHGHRDASGHYVSDGAASGPFTPQFDTSADGSSDQHWAAQPTDGSGATANGVVQFDASTGQWIS